MPNPTARANREALFPDHTSTLTTTDPELRDYFDDFAFDEVLSHDELDPRTRLMTQVAALIAVGAVAEFRMMAGAALTVGVTPVELKEVVYQAVPYVGMGRVRDVLNATNDLLAARTSKKAASPAGETASDLLKRGTEGTRTLDPLHHDDGLTHLAAHRVDWRRLGPSPL